ncbi:hypothetical protein ILYODFUR_034235 [Ilyodon furcidens]|uniref:Uncharacterized protein n=1 Tax=Ilyodon furcidens TaxID=33524 RepID=A0ABV0ULD7_9TELE
MVAQLVALLPCSKKVLGSTPGRGSFCMEFAGWTPPLARRLLEIGSSSPVSHFGISEKTVKKGKKDKKGKKTFFEELSTDNKPEKANEAAGKDSQTKQPQKKKERRKGKGVDVGENDEDVMLTLKNLSVQASDEEDEPDIIPIQKDKKKTGNIFAALSQGQSDDEQDLHDDDDKPAMKTDRASSLLQQPYLSVCPSPAPFSPHL